MKCISKKLLCILCTASFLLTGCGTEKALLNEYNTSYNHSYTNTDVKVNADYFATGHYAQIEHTESGHLLKNIEPFLRYSITSCNFSQILTIAKVSSLQYSKRWFL